ncbi:MAG: hypothetical protein LBD20_02680 [Spirochaetaceae bacterium]|jgi:hypothetical protein|nr:hypothetical protein [Spirochaetaceae bacterium]
MNENYPAWLNSFNFPPDIDKADISNLGRAILWTLKNLTPIEASAIIDMNGNFIVDEAGNLLTAV